MVLGFLLYVIFSHFDMFYCCGFVKFIFGFEAFDFSKSERFFENGKSFELSHWIFIVFVCCVDFGLVFKLVAAPFDMSDGF